MVLCVPRAGKPPSQGLLPRIPTCGRLEGRADSRGLDAQTIENNLPQPHQFQGGNRLTGSKAAPGALDPLPSTFVGRYENC